MSKEQEKNACDWLENLEGDAWADACEEIAGAVKRQAEGAQGEWDAAIAKFAETCPMTAESAAGGKPYDIELRRYYLLGWDDRAALAQPSPAPELERPEAVAFLLWPLKGSMAGQRFTGLGDIPADANRELYGYERLMTVAQHERIEAARVAEIEEMDGLVKRLGDLLSELAVALRGPEPPLTRYGYADLPLRVKTLVEERDAAQARMAELEKQEPVGVMRASGELGVAPYADIWPWLEPGTQLYAAPVAQAGQVPKELREAVEWADHLLFECGALVQTRAPSVHVYNKAFAAIEAAKTLLASASAQGGE